MRFLPALTLAAVAAGPALAQLPATAPALDLSGVIFGSYATRTDSAARASLGGKSPNAFGIDRAYLTFRMPAGDNGQVRVTTDVFQNTNAATNGYYQGWAMRVKYAYFQYTGLRDVLGPGSSVTGRVGALPTIIIEQVEQSWPRYLQQSAVERAGYFSSTDVGAAALVTLPNKWGEVYGLVVNGPGYTSYERDRFKDFALRASLTPLAGGHAGSYLGSLVVAPWIYRGSVGSQFAAGGAGQVGPGENGAITDALTRNRHGVFAALRDRRLTLGASYSERVDESETGGNTVASPRAVADSTGRLIDAFVLARPLEWFDATRRSPWSVIARFDRFTPNTSPDAPAYAGTTPRYDFTVLGAAYDVNQRITLAVDWQVNAPKGFPAATPGNVRPSPRQSTVFIHWQATF